MMVSMMGMVRQAFFGHWEQLLLWCHCPLLLWVLEREFFISSVLARRGDVEGVVVLMKEDYDFICNGDER